MNIAFLDYDTLGYDISIEKFNKFGKVIVYGFTKYEQTIERLKDIDIAITNKVIIDKNIIDNTNLKQICVAATGMNNIDLAYAKEKNIIVNNVAGYSTNSVIQLTFTFVLNFVQEFEYYTKYTQSGLWSQSNIFVNLDKPFYELSNKTWGIIGLGTIGKGVANIAKTFGCNIQYYSTSKENNSTEFNRVELDELLKTSDIITIHSPLNENTKNLLTYKELSSLKDGTILVNVGRGGIINESDLAKILDEKMIFAGLDVISTEPIAKDNPLNFIQNKEQLKITPHIGWSSIEARNRLTNGIIENIEKFVLQYKL